MTPHQRLHLKRAFVYLLLTYVLSWGAAGLFFRAGIPLRSLTGMFFALGYMCMPLLAAVIMQRLVLRQPVWPVLGVHWSPNRWWLVAWLTPPVLAVATFGVTLLVPGVRYTPGMEGMFERYGELFTSEELARVRTKLPLLPVHPFWLALGQSLGAGITVNALAAFGEEVGWRGFLLRQLACLGFWRASLVIGIAWGLWHAPLILQGHNYPEHPLLGVLMMTVSTLLVTPLMIALRIRGRSVLVAAIFHGTLNAAYVLAILLIAGGNDLTTGLFGLPGWSVLIVANVAFLLYDRYFAREKIMTSATALPATGW